MVCSKKDLAMIRFHTPTAPGRTTAQTVSSMPRSRTTRYLVMSPPSKNMVITNRSIRIFRPGMSLRDSA